MAEKEIDVLQQEYKEKYGKAPAAAYKNNALWLANKLDQKEEAKKTKQIKKEVEKGQTTENVAVGGLGAAYTKKGAYGREKVSTGGLIRFWVKTPQGEKEVTNHLGIHAPGSNIIIT